jgi:hypothetical protein
VFQLGPHRLVQPLPVELAPQQISRDVGLRPGSSRRLDVAPGQLLGAGATGVGPLAGVAVFRRPLLQIALGQSQFLALEGQLLFQHLHPLPVPSRELLSHPDRLGIRHLRRKVAAALGRQRPLGCGDPVTQDANRDLQLEECGMKLDGTGLSIARRRVVGEELLEPGPEPFKHGGIVRVAESPNGTDHPGGRQGSQRVTLRDMRRSSCFLLLLLLACGTGRTGGACGITSIAGATMLLQQFAVPNQTLGAPPASLPSRLVARVAAGPAFESVIGRTEDRGWVIGVEGSLPAAIQPGFGVLVLDLKGAARGVLIYESDPIRGAPVIGKLNVDSLMLPLLGIQLDPARFEDARCPLFPDSILP